MALTTVENNNKLVQYSKELYREFVRENMFSPYMGDGINAIIRRRMEPKKGGEQMNIPLVTKLSGRGVSTGTLVGNEEKIDNYGMRLWIDWARHAVVTNEAEEQKDSADIFGEAKPLLSDWGLELQRDEFIQAFMSLPSESPPAGLGSVSGQRVNGILYELATAAQRNTWNAANSDRVLYGALISNYNATHATALGNVDATDDKLTAAAVSKMKAIAEQATPAIRPYKTRDGYEYYVMFVGSHPFRDLKADPVIIANNREARAREGNGMDRNPLFQDGDLIHDGVIIRKVPEISTFVTDVWTTLKTAGASSSRVEPAFLCGQQAMAIGWAKPSTPTFRREDDYQFIKGVGVKMAYGIGKIFKKHPNTGSDLKQWGVVTGFFSAATNA